MGLIGNAIMLVFVVMFFAIIAGILLHKIIGGYIEGSTSGFQVMLSAGLFIGLLISIITMPASPVSGLIAFLIIAFFAGVAVIKPRLEQRDAQRFEEGRISEFRRSIASDPRNLAARSYLVKALEGQKRYDEAIQELSELLKMAPSDRAETYHLETLLKKREEHKAPPITCPSCGHKNPPDRTRCINCEGEMRLLSEIQRWLKSGGMKQIVITWVITAAIIGFIALGLSTLSVIGRILIIALLLLVVILAELIYAHRQF